MIVAMDEEELKGKIAKRLADLNAEKKTPQSGFVRDGVDVSQQRVWDWSNAKPLPLQWLNVRALAQWYEVSADYILMLTDNPQPASNESLPDGATEIIGYLSEMSGRGREQLLRIAKTLYEDDQEWRQDQDLRKGLKLILGDTAFAAIEAELPAMLADPSNIPAATRRILDTLRQNLDGDSGQ